MAIERHRPTKRYRIGIIGAALTTLMAASSAIATSKRPWSFVESIAVRYISGSQNRPEVWAPGGTSYIQFSPDRAHFFFIEHSGNLQRDTNVYTLNVYSSQDILNLRDRRKRPRPLRSLKFESASSTNPAISDAQWDESGTSILFLGTTVSGPLQLYRFAIATGALEQLTDVPRQVGWFRYRDGGLIFSTQGTSPDVKTERSYPIVPISLNANGVPRRAFSMSGHVYVSYGGSKARPIDASLGLSVIAPGGSTAIAIRRDGGKEHFVVLDMKSGAMSRIAQVGDYHFKGKDGKLTPLPEPTAVWSRDGSQAFLVNAVGQGRPERDMRSVVASYELANRSTTSLVPMLEVAPHGQIYVSRVDLQLGGMGARISYRSAKGAGDFVRDITAQAGIPNIGPLVPCTSKNCDSVPNSDTRLDCANSECPSLPRIALDESAVFVRQSANEPPIVVAKVEGNEIPLQVADPALSGVRFSKMQTVNWIESDGRKVSGGLILPAKSNGRRPPLVIQVYHFMPQYFLPDGTHSAGFAAQVLAANGFAVLQIAAVDEREYSLGAEGPNFVDRIDAAVNMLHGRRLIDADRVGVVGFSRSGFQTLYAVTHPGKTNIRAAAVLDAWTGAFPTYLRQASQSFSPLDPHPSWTVALEQVSNIAS